MSPSATSTSPATAAQALGRFVSSAGFDDLTVEIVENAKMRLLDVFGCAFAGRDLAWSRIAFDVVSKAPGSSTVIGHGTKIAAKDAALVNSVLSHSILQEDWGPGGHPGMVVVPPALAMAEEQRSTGRELLTAIAVGYEIQARIAGVVLSGTGRRPFRALPLVGPFSGAAAASSLMKLDPSESATALCYAANMSGTPNQGWWSGTMEVMFQAGVAAHNGVLSAELAKLGATAAPDTLEGSHGFFRAYGPDGEHNLTALTAGLGTVWEGMPATRQKNYCAGGVLQVPIDLSRTLYGRPDLNVANIDHIIVRVPAHMKTASGHDNPPPWRTMFQAQMSIQHCVVAGMLGRPVSDPTYWASQYDDPEVTELGAKVEMVGEVGRDFTRPRIEVYRSDGPVIIADDDHSDVLRPTWESTLIRFRNLAPGLVGDKAEQIVEAVRALDTSASVDNMMSLLAP